MNTTSDQRAVAFVIPHPYVDALACFREPIRLLADEGWEIDLYTSFSPVHPAPFFGRENVSARPGGHVPRRRDRPRETTRLSPAQDTASS